MLSSLHQFLSSMVLSRTSTHYQRLRDSMWLYLALVLLVEEDGAVRKSFQELSRLTGIKPATLRSWAGHLRKAGLIRLEQMGSVEVLKFHVHGLAAHEEAPKTQSQAPGDPEELQESSERNPMLVALAAFVRRGLSDEEASLEEYIELCEHVPREVIKTAFEQSRRVPAEKIRKSRAALFRYLIQTYANKQK